MYSLETTAVDLQIGVLSTIGLDNNTQCCFNCMPYQNKLAFILRCVVEISFAVQLLQALA